MVLHPPQTYPWRGRWWTWSTRAPSTPGTPPWQQGTSQLSWHAKIKEPVRFFKASHLFCLMISQFNSFSRDQRESRKNLDLDNFWPVSTNLSLDNPENCGLDQISISTIHKLWVSHKSRSRQFWNFKSRDSLDLDNSENLNLVLVLTSTIFRFFYLKIFKDLFRCCQSRFPLKYIAIQLKKINQTL